MKLFDRESLFEQLNEMGAAEWAATLRSKCERAFHPQTHGILNDWMMAWHQLPTNQNCVLDASNDVVTVRPGSKSVDSATIAPRSTQAPKPRHESSDNLSDFPHLDNVVSPKDDDTHLRETLMQFHPWRKGPFEIFGVQIDTEWRSDWKWNRIRQRINLNGHMVLDVGCGNGYYGWRMLDAGASMVCGLDPFLLYVMQYEVLRRFASPLQLNYVLPLGDDAVVDNLKVFDTVFSMGVLYHRTSPVDHLQTLWSSLRPGGQCVLETLVIPDQQPAVLVPENRYAKMRNVWFIPSVAMLQRWLHRTGFRNCELIDLTPTTTDEQRRTEWMSFESLTDFLDPNDLSKTIEGYPGPLRATILAHKMKGV